jgi:hypothetical protein
VARVGAWPAWDGGRPGTWQSPRGRGRVPAAGTRAEHRTPHGDRAAAGEPGA